MLLSCAARPGISRRRARMAGRKIVFVVRDDEQKPELTAHAVAVDRIAI